MSDGPALGVIVPRWEWRTFGPDLDRLGDVGAVFATLPTDDPVETDETYVLVGGAGPVDHVVKVRGGLLDIKRLGEVDALDLQRWAPIHKAAFPLSTTDVATAWAALGLPGTAPTGPVADPDGLATVLAAASPDVRVVVVHKRRVRGTLDGVAVELSDVSAEGRSTRTVAAEATDAAAVAAVVERLGLNGFVNTSYPVGLTELLTDRPPRYAVIDVGTNSVKFHLAERDPHGGWRPLVDRAEVTRLGEGIEETGDIAPPAVDRTRTAIDAMVREAREAGARAILAVGTAGLRAAGNRDAVVEAFRERTGITVRVISGADEARLAYQATVAALGPGASAAAVFDTGGGSTQFTFGHEGRIDAQTSVPLGAVGLTDRFGLAGPVDATTVAAAQQAVAEAFAMLADRPRPSGLVGMGGAVTNLAAVHHRLAVYDPTIIFGTVLDRAAIDQQIETYRALDADGRRSIIGLQPARAEVILAGACIVRVILDLLDQPSVTVSDRGLRHGLLAERFEPRSGPAGGAASNGGQGRP